MKRLDDFYKTLYAKKQILSKAKHQLSVINDDMTKAFDASGKLDRSVATDVIAQSAKMKSIIESTQLSIDGTKDSIATMLSQSSLVRLAVIADIKKAKILTSDDLKEVGNIATESRTPSKCIMHSN